MKIWMDLSQYLPFFYPTFVVIGLLVYFFLRSIVVFFIDIAIQSKDLAPSKKPSGIVANFFGRFKSAKQVHKPDVSEDSISESGAESRPLMTAEKVQIYRMAKVLFQQNKIVEAAQMLETIGLAEKAVKVLVKHGKLDEAAATLVRLNATDRAAALLEQIQRFDQAAELYGQLENWAKAARCFEQQAKHNFHFYQSASDCYLKADLLEEALAARAKLGLVEDVFQLCVTRKAWAFLGRYLEFPAYAYRVLPLFDATLLDEFLMELEPVPHTALLLAHWINYRSDAAMVLTILRKFGSNPALASIFWQHLDHYGFETMSQRSLAIRHELNSSLIKTHAEALLAAGRADLAHKLLAPNAMPPLPVSAIVMKI